MGIKAIRTAASATIREVVHESRIGTGTITLRRHRPRAKAGTRLPTGLEPLARGLSGILAA
jgi:hypothetical protein